MAPLPAVLFSASCLAQAPDEQFTADMIARIANAHPGETVIQNPDESFSAVAKQEGQEDRQYFFGRIHGYCENASAAECEAAKQEYVTKTGVEPPKAVAANLRLSVRDADYVGSIAALQRDAPGKVAFYEPIGEDLYAILVLDAPDTIQMASEAQLKELGLTKEAAWQLAASQTRAELPDLPTAAALSQSAVAYQDQEYLASLLIDLPAWTKLSQAVGSDLFMTVVADNFVFVGSMSDDQVSGFRETVEKDCRAQQRCVSPNIYRFRDGRWMIAP